MASNASVAGVGFVSWPLFFSICFKFFPLLGSEVLSVILLGSLSQLRRASYKMGILGDRTTNPLQSPTHLGDYFSWHLWPIGSGIHVLCSFGIYGSRSHGLCWIRGSIG